MRGATKTSRARDAGEKESSLPDFDHWEKIQQEKRANCKHFNAVPVDNDVLGTVAWLCPDCDMQLPATFTPPQMRGEMPDYDPSNPQSKGWTIQGLTPAMQDVWRHETVMQAFKDGAGTGGMSW